MTTHSIGLRAARVRSARLSWHALSESFWKWWVGLYAAPPRRLPPML